MAGAPLLVAAALALQPPPVFETAVDVLAVDASVLDARGVPVRGLAAAEFRVTVDGQARRVLSAEFVDLGAGVSSEPSPQPEHFTTNAGARPGRLVIIAVDQGQIAAGQGRSLIRSADGLLDQLTPADRVGLVAFPAPAPPGIEPTADHRKVRAALGTLVGRASRVGSGRLGPTEALAYQGGDSMRWQSAVERECPPSMDQVDRELCVAEVEGEAMQLASEMRQRTAASLGSLRSLFAGLAGIEGPKSVVLITEGLWTEHPGDTRELAERAAAARVTLYVLQLESVLQADASVARPSETALDDQDLRASPLASLAALAGGAVFRVVGSGEGPMQRIARELSGHYVLAVEPEDADRDGREHEVRVKLGRAGLSVRARGRVTIPRPGTRPSLEQQLAATLRSPFVQTGLGVRATTYNLGGGGGAGKPRLLVAAEVSQVKAAPLGYALQLVDEKGAVSPATAQRLDTLSGEPVAFAATLAVPAGRYTLRIAVVDGSGRRGSLERPVELALRSAGELETSDLLLGRPPGADGRMEPGVDVKAGTGGISAHLELYGRRFDGVNVRYEVAERGGGPSLLSAAGRLLERGEGERTSQVTFATDLLPPGNYVLRAIVEAEGRAHPPLAQPFRVEAGSAAAQADRRLPFEAVRPALRRFERRQLLAPEVVAYFVERMTELLPGPLGPQLEQAIAHARAGELDDLRAVLAGAGSSDARVLFLRGVALLGQPGSLPQAIASLREAVRASSSLLPATVYLGGCLAANGEDREAAGAWQTSLLGESGSPAVYALLADALLRLDEVEQAEAIVTEALESWPDDEAMKRRLGLVAARKGERERALELLGAHTEKHPDDAAAQLLTLRLLLQSLTSGGSPDPLQQQRALRAARAYVAAGGPEQQLVESWLRYLEKAGSAPAP